MLADDLMVGDVPIMQQMIDLFAQHQCSILAVQEVPQEHTNRYGIVQGDILTPDLVKITGLIEKPHPSIAPSNLAIAGRYILTTAVFDAFVHNPVAQVAKFSSLMVLHPCLIQNKYWLIATTVNVMTAEVDWVYCRPVSILQQFIRNWAKSSLSGWKSGEFLTGRYKLI